MIRVNNLQLNSDERQDSKLPRKALEYSIVHLRVYKSLSISINIKVQSVPAETNLQYVVSSLVVSSYVIPRSVSDPAGRNLVPATVLNISLLI